MNKFPMFALIALIALLFSDSVSAVKSSDLLRARLAVRRNHVKGRESVGALTTNSHSVDGKSLVVAGDAAGHGADLKDEQYIITYPYGYTPADPKTMEAIGEAGRDIGLAAGEFGREMGKNAAELGRSLGGMASNLGTNLGGMAANLGESLGGFGRNLGESLGGMGRNLGESLGGMGRDLGKALGGVGTLGGNLGQTIGGFGTEIGKSAAILGNNLGETMRGVGDIGRHVGDVARNLGQSLGGMGREVGRSVGEFGRSIGEMARNLGEGLRHAVNKISERALNGSYPIYGGYNIVYPGTVMYIPQPGIVVKSFDDQEDNSVAFDDQERDQEREHEREREREHEREHEREKAKFNRKGSRPPTNVLSPSSPSSFIQIDATRPTPHPRGGHQLEHGQDLDQGGEEKLDLD